MVDDYNLESLSATQQEKYLLQCNRYPVEDPNQLQPNADGMRHDQLCDIKINDPGRAEYNTARFNLLNSNYFLPIFGFESLSIFKKNVLIGNNSLAPVETTDNPYYNPYCKNVAHIDLVTGILMPILSLTTTA